MGEYQELFCKKITDMLSGFGLCKDNFYIACGAQRTSVIHCNAKNKIDKEKDRINYLIQFCESEEVVFICDIRKRVELGASLDLTWQDLHWKDVKDFQAKSITIVNTSIETPIAVMPFSYFSIFLKENNSCGFTIDIQTVPKEMEEDEYHLVGKEGGKIEVYSTRYERDPQLRKKAIEIHGYRCCACGFLFNEVYGIEYIEVHHIKPLHTFEGEEKVNPETDMVCLCANCHRIVHHKRNEVLSIEKLKEKIDVHTKDKKYEEELS